MKVNVQAVIKEAVNAGLQAGRAQATNETKNAYKDTEKRLYAYPVLLERIADKKEQLQEIFDNGMPEHSKELVRFQKTGLRLSSDEIAEAVTHDLNAAIAADEYEVSVIGDALKTIESDFYYTAIKGKYFNGLSDDDIAESIPCDTSTVRRNRGRLIRILAVRLYGAQAL